MDILHSIILVGWEMLKLLLILAGILFVIFLLTALWRSLLTLYKRKRLITGSQATKSPSRPKAPQGMNSDPKAPPSLFDQKTKH